MAPIPTCRKQKLDKGLLASGTLGFLEVATTKGQEWKSLESKRRQDGKVVNWEPERDTEVAA